MSSLSLLFFLSPTITLHSRYYVLAPSRAEICNCRGGGRLGVSRGEKDMGVPHLRKLVAAQAGIGRYSGAIHGSNTRRARRRRPTENFDENSSGNENEQLEMQGLDEKMNGSYDNSGLDGVIHDDGEPAPDPTDSHQRYLAELRVNEHIVDSGYQTHGCKRVAGGSTWVSVGAEGDLGYQQVDSVNVSKGAQDDQLDDVGVLEEAEGRVVVGSESDEPGKGDGEKGEHNKSARGRKVKKNKGERDLSVFIGYLEEVEPVAATVISNPELFVEPNMKEAEQDVIPAISRCDNEGRSPSLLTKDVLPDEKETSVVSTLEVSEKSKKQKRRTRKKSAVNLSEAANFPTDELQVRVVEGEAEQPSFAQKLPLNQSSRHEARGNIFSPDSDIGITPFGSIFEPEDIGLEGREGSGMAKDMSEVFGIEIGNEECETGAPIPQSTVSVSSSRSDPVVVGEEELSANVINLLKAELITEQLGERSELVNAEAERGVTENDFQAEIKATDDDCQVGTIVQADVGATVSSSGAILSSRSSLLSSSNESLDMNSLTKQTGAAVLSLSIEGESFQSAGGVEVTNAVVDQAVQVVSKVAELPAHFASKVVELPAKVASKVVELPAQVASKAVELPGAVVEQATQVGTLVVEQVVEILPDAVTEQVGQVVSQVVDLQTQISDQMSLVTDHVVQIGQMMVDQVSEAGDCVVEQVNATAEQVVQVAETVTSTANQVAESVTSTANQVVEQVTEKVTDIFSADDDDDSDSDDEFESYKTSDDPAFRGTRGLANFVILQEDQGILAKIYDFYTYMLKQPLPKFAAAMFSAPIIVSVLFTLLYLPGYQGLAFDETARDFFAAAGGDAITLQMSWRTVFQLFMFSLSLSTGLQPELAPLSPYTLVIANINALVAQLVFVFLSGAVFARLSQPAQPVRCSSVALVSTSPAQRKRKENAIKVLMTRYVLAGPQPCELVDVKVDLTYKYNTITRMGSYFRATQSLKLVRPEIAFLTHGMLVRHVIDHTSPLYQRTAEMLRKEDAVFVLSVVGLERSSMQSVFHVQHYCVCDDHVIWDAEFEDLFLINSKKNKRIVDHSRLSMWRSIKA